MLDNFTKRRRLAVLLAVLSVVALVLVGRWLNATKIGGQQPAEPFRIAGNFYYVGANDVAAFLITGPEGHVVLDGGYPTTARSQAPPRRTRWTRSSTPRATALSSMPPKRRCRRGDFAARAGCARGRSLVLDTARLPVFW